ncbi:7TM-DISM domain-containing protein [Flavobacterium sp. 7A]|uniref:7TMR-DISMED2 domain-containing protein n=1 Tax=Flavobacterium sp. 7A TaxID=2940571 RepID=UPI0039B3F522
MQNATNTHLNYYFETARPITDRVELYVVNSKTGAMTKTVSGDKMPFKDRAYRSRKTIFKLDIQPNSKVDLFASQE